MNGFWDEDELLKCHNHCDWTGTVADLDNPEADVYRCPKCGASTDMIMSAQPPLPVEAATQAQIILALRKKIHLTEHHNQFFERCESRWCNPNPPLASGIGLEDLSDPAAGQHVGDPFAVAVAIEVERRMKALAPVEAATGATANWAAVYRAFQADVMVSRNELAWVWNCLHKYADAVAAPPTDTAPARSRQLYTERAAEMGEICAIKGHDYEACMEWLRCKRCGSTKDVQPPADTATPTKAWPLCPQCGRPMQSYEGRFFCDKECSHDRQPEHPAA